MNYYLFHLGDYASKTRHLSWDEDMAYRRLLDLYYSTEAPLPKEKQSIYRLTMARTPEQQAAIDIVLAEFFEETSDGYRNSRCDEEVARCADKKAKASQSARTRWGNADAMRTHSEGNAPNTQYPIPNTQEIVVATPRILEPKELVEEASHKATIQNLFKTAKLNDWEREFLRSIAGKKVLTRSQRESFDAILVAQEVYPGGGQRSGSDPPDGMKRLTYEQMKKMGLNV